MTTTKIGEYRNGNFNVSIFSDGTKIRENSLDSLTPDFPECIDLNVSNRCNRGCPFCYLCATPDGKHGRFDYRFLDTLKSYTELAININDWSNLPRGLVPFLRKMKKQKVIVNATINQATLQSNEQTIKILHDKGLITGLGVSLTHIDLRALEKWNTEFPNMVIHTIAGLLTKEQIDALSNKGFRILILGYKTVGRGKDFLSSEVEQGIEWLEENIASYLDRFKVISFDNLAIRQLKLEEKFPESFWEKHYMGDDGQFTMYIDLVGGYCAENSLSFEKHEIKDKDTIKDLFNKIKKKGTS